MFSSIKNFVYREKMSSDTVNLIGFINFDNFCCSQNKRKNQKTKTHLNQIMAGKTGTIEVHVLTYFQNIC